MSNETCSFSEKNHPEDVFKIVAGWAKFFFKLLAMIVVFSEISRK